MKIAFVTGASSGIGQEFVRQIDRICPRLDEIWVAARRTERLKKLEQHTKRKLRIFDGDLCRDYLFEKIQKELERNQADIRVLVLSAGYGKMGKTEDIPIQELLGMIDLNCRSLTRMIGICLPFMSRGSRILPIASAAAFSPQPGFAVYAASKSYVYSLAIGLGEELRGKGIFVTVVCPGPVETEFFDRSGQLPGKNISGVRAKKELVVHQALRDSAKRKKVSVYGGSMKAARVLAKVVPYTMTASLMKRINHINESEGAGKDDED